MDLEGRGEIAFLGSKACLPRSSVKPCNDDGLVFDPESLHVARIKEDQEYEGLRANFVARRERAKIHMQVGIGFGDANVPPPHISKTRNTVSTRMHKRRQPLAMALEMVAP